jgi:hypothetical protein
MPWSGDQIAVLVLAARAPTLLGGVLGGRAVDALGPCVLLLVGGFLRAGASAGIVLAQITHRDGNLVIVA